jgi:hypothetical protein
LSIFFERDEDLGLRPSFNFSLFFEEEKDQRRVEEGQSPSFYFFPPLLLKERGIKGVR